MQVHTSLFIMHLISSESSFVRYGPRRLWTLFVRVCLPYIKIWDISTMLFYIFHTGCSRSPILKYYVQSPPTPQVTTVRAWWYLEITHQGAGDCVSLDVWWWSTLINQQRLQSGDSPALKSNQGGILKGEWFHFNASNFLSRKTAGRKGTISTLSPLQTWCFRLERGKKKTGARCPGKARVIWTWSCGADPAELCLYEKPQKVSFMITALREKGAVGVSALKGLSICCCRKLEGTLW